MNKEPENGLAPGVMEPANGSVINIDNGVVPLVLRTLTKGTAGAQYVYFFFFSIKFFILEIINVA